MPKFYFHLRSSKSISIDEYGIDLPNAAVACREALISAHEIMTEMVVVNALYLSDALLEVVDQTGETVVVVSFREAAADPLYQAGRNPHRLDVSMIGIRH